MKVFALFCFSTIVIFGFITFQKANVKENLSEPIDNQIIRSTTVEIESNEEKAVRIAEEFIRKNGYTDVPADKDNISHETVEFYDSIDELLKERFNTLEPKAFGIFYNGRNGENSKGWTVAFRYNKSYLKELSDKDYKTLGRAVTMDKNFKNLRVEHKNIFLDKVDKKF